MVWIEVTLCEWCSRNLSQGALVATRRGTLGPLGRNSVWGGKDGFSEEHWHGVDRVGKGVSEMVSISARSTGWKESKENGAHQ